MSQLEALLHGISHLEPVDLLDWSGPEVKVRPLSASEAAQVERDMVRGMVAEAGVIAGNAANARPVITDLGLLMAGQKQASIKAVAFGLTHSGETCTEEQAARLPAPWADALSRTVFRISGMDLGDSLDFFRDAPGMDGAGENGGRGDAAPVPSGAAPGPEPAGIDQASA